MAGAAPFAPAGAAGLNLLMAVAIAVLVVLAARRPDRLRALGIALGVLPWAFLFTDGAVPVGQVLENLALLSVPLLGAVLLVGVVHTARSFGRRTQRGRV
ncbi:hypothetical protein ACEZDB_06970 [Streptacidiphilus sp. N1-3]|uniref:Integral membrane protein n=1 Tax=Streptacidiphilus alkalitolerans TaxID=3342712 RepID=A0ABV6WWS6_9ACTN